MIREIQYLPQTDFVPNLNRFLVVFLFNCVSKNYIHFINMQNKKNETFFQYLKGLGHEQSLNDISNNVRVSFKELKYRD